MESALKQGVEQSLQGSAQTIAAALDGQEALLYRENPSQASRGAAIFAHRLPGRPTLDGYRDDWGLATTPPLPLADDPNTTSPGGEALYWAGVRDRYLYLYLEVGDENIEYSTPVKTGDHVSITDNRGRRLGFATAAPGPLGAAVMSGATFTGEREQRIAAFWRELPSGYAIEIQAPLDAIGESLNLQVTDANTGTIAATASQTADTGPLIYPLFKLTEALRPFAQDGLRIRIVDLHGWLLANQGRVTNEEGNTQTGGLLSTLYGWVLKPADQQPYEGVATGWLTTTPVKSALAGQPDAAWFSNALIPGAIVQVSQPLMSDQQIMGAVVLERSSGNMLTLTNQALTRLMNFTLLATLVAALGSVGYATLLSLRVRRLARAAEEALGPRGELNSQVPGTGAGDELGILARSFSRLLSRLADYNGYLRSLASKLSHELRTPLAVITSSLENLEQEQDPEQRKVYQQRLQLGAQRLDRLVSAMSEATHIEQAVKDAERIRYQPGPVIEAAVRGYQDAYPERRFKASSNDAGITVSGSPDLLVQLLDKLVDNALSFAPHDAVIDVCLEPKNQGELVLRVGNPGPLLPESMTGRLFDSLISIRDAGDDKPHLGLGLFIVRLIAEHHGGSVAAMNQADGSGVVFQVQLPGEILPDAD